MSGAAMLKDRGSSALVLVGSEHRHFLGGVLSRMELLPRREEQEGRAPAKRVAVGATTHDLQKYLELTMKTTCSLKLAERIFRAVSTDTYVLEPDDAFVLESKRITTEYNAQSKQLSAEVRKKTLGEPHAQVFNGWVAMALKHHQEKNNQSEIKRLTKFGEIMMRQGK